MPDTTPVVDRIIIREDVVIPEDLGTLEFLRDWDWGTGNE